MTGLPFVLNVVNMMGFVETVNVVNMANVVVVVNVVKITFLLFGGGYQCNQNDGLESCS